MSSRDLQAKRTKNKIFNTANDLINKKGFENISVCEICKKAEVSIGTFYYYFKSKRDIFFEIYRKADNYFEIEVVNNLKAEDSLGMVKEYLKSYIKFVNSEGVARCKNLYIPDNKLFIKKGRAMQTILKGIIEEGQKKDYFSDKISPEEAVRFSFVILRGIVFDWCLHDGNYDIISYAEEYIDNICNYLSAQDKCLSLK